MTKLVIVESPGKTATIEKYLGTGYKVMASYGHIRDLPEDKDPLPESASSLPWAREGVNVDGNFELFYMVSPRQPERGKSKEQIVRDLRIEAR